MAWLSLAEAVQLLLCPRRCGRRILALSCGVTVDEMFRKRVFTHDQRSCICGVPGGDVAHDHLPIGGNQRLREFTARSGRVAVCEVLGRGVRIDVQRPGVGGIPGGNVTHRHAVTVEFEITRLDRGRVLVFREGIVAFTEYIAMVEMFGEVRVIDENRACLRSITSGEVADGGLVRILCGTRDPDSLTNRRTDSGCFGPHAAHEEKAQRRRDGQ